MSLAQRPWVAQAALATPLGPARIAATAQGLGGFWFDDQAHHPGPLKAPEDPAHPVLRQTERELARYWDDAQGTRFEVPLDLGGTEFQQAVWRALLGIACGAHSSYAAIAQAIGNPRAVRAVGAAVGRNPVSLIVPCHRVLGSNGSLTGYAGGLHRKRDLLVREHVLSATLI
ncbi:MAG TPA: methylated-DNA--[protein]-cysteine S-methyltransferase [Ideonella sp.]|nr:methylated-DNA--[protein]-cysteine S-methyltransferase [Ideonella sp.]